MTIFTYYNEPLDEIAGRSQLVDWTGQENPSSLLMETLGIHTIAILDEKAGLPFELKKAGLGYIATYPDTALAPRFGYLSESDRGNAVAITQTTSPGQTIHKPQGSERMTISAINELPTDILLFIKWGESQSSHRLRAFSGLTTLPVLYVGLGVDISAWADTQGLLITGGWEG